MDEKKIQILVATNHLNSIGGTEVYTYSIIEELKKRDYSVEYFTFHKGISSEKIEQLGVKFKSKNYYDLILANHITTVEKLYRYGFIIQTCHGIYPHLEQPSKFADAYVSISEEVKAHLLKLGLSSELILNGINLNRFKPIRPINKELKSILSLSQSDEANNDIKTVCDKLNIKFNSNNKFKEPVWNIENEINKSDLVIGLGRSVYDAISCGRNVIIFDNRPYVDYSFGDGYVTNNNINDFIKYNCSGRYSKQVFNKKKIEKEILYYSQENGKHLRKFAEENLSIDNAINEYLDYYKIQKNKHSTLMKIFRNSYLRFILKKESIIYFIKSKTYLILSKIKILKKTDKRLTNE